VTICQSLGSSCDHAVFGTLIRVVLVRDDVFPGKKDSSTR